MRVHSCRIADCFVLLAVAVLGSPASHAFADPPPGGSAIVTDGNAGPSGARLFKPPPTPPSMRFRAPVAGIPAFALPAVNVEALLAEDAASGGCMRIGIARPVRLVPQVIADGRGGQWRDADGGRIWSVDLVSASAIALRVHLTDMNLPEGVQMFAYAPDHPEGIDGPYERLGRCGDGEMWTGMLEGERARIECFVPADISRAGAFPDKPFIIDQILHVYVDPLAIPMRDDGGIAGTCHNDVTCNSSYTSVSHSVARISFVENGNGFLCCGALINPQNGDLTPYFLTSNTCIATNTVAQTAQFFWLYQTSSCNGTPPTLSSVPKSSVATLAATGTTSDFSILMEEGALPCGLFWSGFDANAINNGQSSALIHHPVGGAKRISFGTKATADSSSCSTGAPNYLRINYTDGTSESGSEGAPIYRSDTQRVYGQLSCGPATCSNMTFDNYGALSATYSGSTTVQTLLAGGTDDVLEPNDTCATAITISEGTFTNRIVKYQHDDWFKITVPAGGTLSATLTFTDANGDIDMELFSTCGGTVLASSAGATNVESFVFTNNGAAANFLLHVFLSDCDVRNSYTMVLSASLMNDACTTATVIPGTATTFNPAPYSTAQADATTSEPQENCEVSAAGVSNTVWYSFTPCGNGTVSIDTFGSNYNTVLAMFTGTCTAATQVACSDDAIGTQARILNFAVIAGTTYLIKVSDYNSSSGGGTLDFNFTYTATAPNNDLCASATVIPAGATSFNPIPFCTVGATAGSELTESCGFTTNSNTVWYAFTPTCNRRLTIDTNGSTYDTVLSVFHGTCGAANEIDCDDDSGTGLNSQLVNVPLTANQPYLIKIADFGNPDGGTLDFNMSAPICCVGDIVPLPIGNGQVDVNDLLAVILSWGNCPSPCPPRCSADIVAPNCVVDVNDLLAVLTHWGACPP